MLFPQRVHLNRHPLLIKFARWGKQQWCSVLGSSHQVPRCVNADVGNGGGEVVPRGLGKVRGPARDYLEGEGHGCSEGAWGQDFGEGRGIGGLMVWSFNVYGCRMRRFKGHADGIWCAMN